ncbi:MAG: D-alanine--D-alanine ligase family protein [bacterium]
MAFLESFGIPYVGSGLDLAPLNKATRKQVVASNSFTTAQFAIADSPDSIPEIDIDYPLFVKPLRGRGSAGISEDNIVYSCEQLRGVVRKITGTVGQAALIERFIRGREMTVGIIGYKKPKVLLLLEIGYNNAKTNTYQHKMFDNEILLCPADLPKESEEKIKENALGIYKALNAKDFGRFDMILGEDNFPYFLELNTYAGLTTEPDEGEIHVHNSYMGCMAKAAGYTRGEFIMEIIGSALDRYGMRDVHLKAV